ncbi:hypothetical protein Tco_1046446 [Tanacetum coccineum]
MATPFANPEREIRARRDTSPALIHNIYSFYESESSESESKDVREIDIETLTLEQYVALNLNNTHKRISNPEDATFEIKGQFLRDYVKLPSQEAQLRMQSSISGKFSKLLVCSTQMIPLSYEFKNWLITPINGTMWKAKKNTPTPFDIITDKLKALNHKMDKLRVDVRKINMNREKKSLHEEIQSIRTSKISYDKSYPKSNIHPTNLKDTFEHYLKESCKREDVLNEWMKKFMINTEQELKIMVL